MIGQFIVNGFITGILYSLLALGFALVYNTTKVFHIAAAGIYVFAAYMFWLFSACFGLPLIFAAIIAVLLTMGLSLATEVTVYRPLKRRKASLNIAMIASIGMMTVIVNLMALFFGNKTKVMMNELTPTIVFCSLIISKSQIYQTIIGIMIIIVFFVVLSTTNWGMKLKALSVDETLFTTLGYNPAATRTTVFLVSGAFIAASSCLTVYEVGIDLNMGMSVLVNAVVSMIIGGVGRFGTCIIGSITLGVLQAVTVYFFSPNWQNAVTFSVLLIFLFLRPQGFAGYKQRII